VLNKQVADSKGDLPLGSWAIVFKKKVYRKKYFVMKPKSFPSFVIYVLLLALLRRYNEFCQGGSEI
jgi:hypothetical protein